MANLSEMVATTMRRRDSDVASNIVNGNALLQRLSARGMIDTVDGGYDITWPVAYAENGNYQRYSGFQQLSVAQTDEISAATFEPKQAATNVVVTGRDERINQGRQRVINYVDAKIKNALDTMKNNISQDIYSNGSLSNQIGGLQLLVADDPTTSSVVGGFNQQTQTWWRNQVYDFSSNSQSAGGSMLEGMNKLYLNCSVGNMQPDLIVADAEYFSIYEAVLQNQERYANVETAEKGFRALKYKTADVVYDGNSGIPANRMYFLNTDYLKLSVYNGGNFEVKDAVKSINQDATVTPIVFMGNLCTNNRRMHGVLKD